MTTLVGLSVRILLAAGLGLSWLVLLGAGPAHACTCVRMEVAASAGLAEQVFSGIVEQRAAGDGTIREVRYTVAVEGVYKGDAPGQVEVTTPGSPASCGLPGLPTGRLVIWFASEGNPAGGRPAEESTDGEPRLFVNSCDGTAVATPALAAAVSDALGEPRAPTVPAPDATSDSPETEPSGAGQEAGQDAQDDTAGDDGAPVWPWLIAGGVVAAGAAAFVVARRRFG